MEYFYTKEEVERAVLVGISSRATGVAPETTREHLEELALLAETAGAETVKVFTQDLEHPLTATLVGKGKLEEIRAFVEEEEVPLVIFDEDLTPTQSRNIEAVLKGRRVIDRTRLILDIFARRARTAEARTQVELAQYQYLLPRLAGMWTHLERQKGGIGLRGPGETEIETDRRIAREKIARLKMQLEKIDRQMATQRKSRGKLVRVALVGYTNAGKSTLMNVLCKSGVLAEDKLFATLDTTVRKIAVRNVPLLVADTVGFIRKLPHHLVEAFKSTLDEVREADVILHVVDVAHPGWEEQVDVVNETLASLLDAPRPTIMVFNKMDAFRGRDEDDIAPDARGSYSLEELEKTWMARQGVPCVFISARDRANVDALKTTLYEIAREIHSARFPFNDFLYTETATDDMP
jgi:GTP-binding protein HflX